LARKGQPVELKPKQVEIKALAFYDCGGQTVCFRAWVSSGTYLRSLAHDLGKKLGCGGHLAVLKRTAVREFTIDEAHSLEQLERAQSTNTLDELFLHPRLVLPEFPAVVASPESAARM
jgi:tRNA pseudouridine55 synthase